MTTESFKRKLTAILSADVEGYSRLMGEDEESTVRTLTAYREIMSSLIQQYRGRVVDSPGDNLLAEFTSVADAVRCAVEIQEELRVRNAELPENRRMEFRIGINLGDVVEEGERIYGDGVNIAARLEALANPGGICISKTAFDQIETKLPLGYEYLGEQTVKNIAKPVGAYRVLMEPRVMVAEEIEKEKALPVWHRKAILAGGVAILLVVIALAIWNFYLRPAPPPAEVASVEKMAFPLPDKPSIAVLPFVNMSGDPEQEYFADGITEDLITDLSKISGLFIIARSSTFTYKGKPVKIRQVAEELGVRYVLEGSVRKADEQVRINAQLIDTTAGGHLWAEHYDGDIGDVFTLQDRIRGKIVAALAVKLTASEQELVARKATNNIAAYDAYLQAVEYFIRLTPDDLAKAFSYLKKAVELDPNFALADASLAFGYWKGSELGWHKSLGVSWQEARIRAREYLKKAMKNPTSIAYTVASEMNLSQRLHEEAIAEAERAIALDPNDPLGHITMAKALIYVGRPEEAIDFVKRAMRLDPRLPGVYLHYLGLAHFCMGQLEEAVTSTERALTYNPEIRGWVLPLAAAYAQLGRNKEARAALENLMKGLPSQVDLRGVMYWYPFKDPEVAERFADGLLQAGLPGEPSGYYKIYEENRLAGEKIRELFFGTTVTGVTLAGEKYRVDRTKDGKATWLATPGAPADSDDSGKSWIEGDMLCDHWQIHYAGHKYCMTVFRNPEGTPEKRDEYLAISDFRIHPFSPVD